ncbi:integrase catalytic subunit [Caballeronia udeis]|uniref:Integrase catalytic subunit n=1 Tax=Caballeronia udeis TaxID=1232866 RepID=A0A158JYZ6_9BURK|nr:integrase catalytic subunit [Caballeronia udeis]
MNVLKQHQQSTVFTPLELKKSQREIHRITGIDRKTIRRYMVIFAARASKSANSPAPATVGSEDTDQTPLHSRDHRLFRPR